MNKQIFAALILSTVCTISSANLYIVYPNDKAQEYNGEDGLKYELLQFGHFKWGTYITGGVRYVEVPDCSVMKNFQNSGVDKMASILIVNLHTNPCALQTYAKSAQLGGAKLLIFIAEEEDKRIERTRWSSSPILSSESIQIPIIMVTKDIGRKLIDIVKEDGNETSSLVI